MDDTTLFDQLCQQAQESGVSEDKVKIEVFEALLRQDMDYFKSIFKEDDGRFDGGETNLLKKIFGLCHHVTPFDIYKRFGPFVLTYIKFG